MTTIEILEKEPIMKMKNLVLSAILLTSPMISLADDCRRIPPVLSAGPGYMLLDKGGEGEVTLYITNRDTVDCSPQIFQITAETPEGLEGKVLAGGNRILPGKWTTNAYQFRVNEDASAGEKYIRFSLYRMGVEEHERFSTVVVRVK